MVKPFATRIRDNCVYTSSLVLKIFDTDGININLNEDKNLHYSIGHGTILEPQIDNDGYFNGYLYDIYDFDLVNYNDYNVAVLNNSALGLQTTGQLSNYYVIIPVRFKLQNNDYVEKPNF